MKQIIVSSEAHAFLCEVAAEEKACCGRIVTFAEALDAVIAAYKDCYE